MQQLFLLTGERAVSWAVVSWDVDLRDYKYWETNAVEF